MRSLKKRLGDLTAGQGAVSLVGETNEEIMERIMHILTTGRVRPDKTPTHVEEPAGWLGRRQRSARDSGA